MLFYANIETKEILFFDPLHRKSRQANTYFKKLSAFLYRQGLSQDIKSILPNSIDYPIQKDLWNCGVYIIYYAEVILNGYAWESEIYDEKYRKYIQHVIIKNSDNLSSTYIYCAEANTDL